MRDFSNGVFATWAPTYRDLGYWPRPIAAGSKACRIKNWQRPDDLIDPAERELWLESFGNAGIGLLLGSPFPDGTCLAGLDIDHDDFVRVTRSLLRNPPCGRIGARGILFPVRIKGSPAYLELKIKAPRTSALKVGELLGETRLAVLPPTIHPTTQAPYKWIGKALHEIPFTDLPLIEV